MPELPDIAVYLEALSQRVLSQRLERIEVNSPFLLRTVEPKPQEAEGHHVMRLRRIGKRIAIGLDNDIWLVLHLMIAGRLHWDRRHGKALAAFTFSTGTLTLTEAGSQHRASLHMVRADDALFALDPGGIDPLEATLSDFSAALTRENHTLKRALTDPRLFSGIGNAYSDEILHRARLSPVTQTHKLSSAEIERLFSAAQSTLIEWMDRLSAAAGGDFPEKVTAFRDEMAVHGKYRQPCPVCRTSVARIRYAANETNYCPKCQTGGRLLADRALSRLLGKDWPRSIDET